MKKRVFLDMDDAVYRIVINTEDWSEGDISLMEQFGEPEVNIGGNVEYVYEGAQKTKEFGDQYVRLLHGFPYARGFDTRDYSSKDEAVSVGVAWKDMVLSRIDASVMELRSNVAPLPTEEVYEI